MDEKQLSNTIANVMTTDIHTVAPTCPLSDALSTMITHNEKCIVASANNKPAGILDHNDTIILFAKYLKGEISGDITVSDVMTKDIESINENAHINQAFEALSENAITNLLVVNEQGEIVGLIEESRLLKSYKNKLEQDCAALETELQGRNEELQAINDHLKILAITDPLLNISNRRAMEEDLERAHATSVRYDRPYAITLFSVDFLKTYTEHYGTPDTDKTLKLITGCIKDAIRTTDRLFRYSNDEFLLLLPETDFDGARIISQRIVDGVASLNIPNEKSELKVVTLSAGVTDNNTGGILASEWNAVVERAANGLVIAIQEGRNQAAIDDSTFADDLVKNIQQNLPHDDLDDLEF